jgi:hypothetical protein
MIRNASFNTNTLPLLSPRGSRCLPRMALQLWQREGSKYNWKIQQSAPKIAEEGIAYEKLDFGRLREVVTRSLRFKMSKVGLNWERRVQLICVTT